MALERVTIAADIMKDPEILRFRSLAGGQESVCGEAASQQFANGRGSAGHPFLKRQFSSASSSSALSMICSRSGRSSSVTDTSCSGRSLAE